VALPDTAGHATDSISRRTKALLFIAFAFAVVANPVFSVAYAIGIIARVTLNYWQASESFQVAPQTRSERDLRVGERRSLAVLALPTLGLALSITVVSTYVPVLARHFVSSSIIIGLIVGTEGLAAVILPVLVGTWSDQLHTRLGGRLPFVLAATPVVAITLITIGVASSLLLIVAGVVVFFAAYFVAYEPYRALYPDLVRTRLPAACRASRRLLAAPEPVLRSAAAESCSPSGRPCRSRLPQGCWLPRALASPSCCCAGGAGRTSTHG
jgi:hypothetical protein